MDCKIEEKLKFLRFFDAEIYYQNPIYSSPNLNKEKLESEINEVNFLLAENECKQKILDKENRRLHAAKNLMQEFKR